MSTLYVSGRERKIVELLVKSTSSMQIHQLAAKLEVSERTIHRDLKHVEDLCEKYQLTLLRQPGKGLQVTGKAVNKQALLQAIIQTKQTDFTPDERRALILLVLLEASYPVKLYTLAKKLHVTEATISNDIDQIIADLTGRKLQLIRRRGYGVEIIGKEKDKRSLISALIKDYVTEIDVLTMLRTDLVQKNKREQNLITNRLLHLINPEKLRIIEGEVDQLRSQLSYGLADSAYIGLVVHLSLVVQRLEHGDPIEFKAAYLEKIIHSKEYGIAKQAVKQLEKALELSIPDAEIGYITMHLLGAKVQKDDNHLLEDTSMGLAQQTKKLILFISEEVGWNLMDNLGLLSDLVTHLKPALFRLEKKMHISNPIIDDIKQNYEDLFIIVQKGLEVTFPEIDFPDEEVGFLVLHFGAALLHTEQDNHLEVLVICPSGIGTAKILGERLMQKFPEIKAVHNVSYFDLNAEKIAAYDLVVSTIVLNDYEDYVQTSPILTAEDIDRIRQMIKRKRLLGNLAKPKSPDDNPISYEIYGVKRIEDMRKYADAVLHVLEKFAINTCVQRELLEVYTRDICAHLMKQEIIGDEKVVSEDLLTRQKIGGLGIPETSLALFHTRSKGVDNISFTMFTLPESIAIEGMDGQQMEVQQMLVLLSPENPAVEHLEVLSYLSGLIIKDELSVQMFERAIEVDVYDFLVDAYNVFMNEKFMMR